MGFPVEMFPVLFAIPRTAGWIAQWEEMLLDPEQKIARPRQIYIGPTQRDYVPRRSERDHARSPDVESSRARRRWPLRPACSSVLLAAARSAASRASRRQFDGDRAWEHLRQHGRHRSAARGIAGDRADARLHQGAADGARLTAVGAGRSTRRRRSARSTWSTSSRPSPARARTGIVIAGHYDTKLFRDFRFVGASDGGSSAAFLLELARVLKARQECRSRSSCCSSTARKRSASGSGTDHTYGSRHYVEAARSDGTLRPSEGADPGRHDRRPRPADHAATRTRRRG